MSVEAVPGGVAQDQFGAEPDVGRMPFRVVIWASGSLTMRVPIASTGCRAVDSLGRRDDPYSGHPLRGSHERAAWNHAAVRGNRF